MKKIIAIGASTSKNSINKTFANFAANQLSNVEVISVDISSYNHLPIFSVDFESDNETPEEITILNSLFKDVDGFIISFAEHNGSYSAGYKNVFDWVSRQEGKIFNNKPTLLLSTSPGGRGGMTVLASAVSVYPHQGANLVGSFSLPSFFDNLKDNSIVDPALDKTFTEEVAKLQMALDKI
ncbi:MAG: NADPH-dependent FMN reductase [Crocinitomicaceae bacterium]